MISPSSTSSSSDTATLAAPPLQPRVRRLARAKRAQRVATHRPYGALAALVCIVLIHIVTANWIYPNAMPRLDLRRKLIPLTVSATPHVIVAGDSRSECGLLPDLLSQRLAIPLEQVINMGTPACDLPGVFAAYREFAPRFAANPILILSVSTANVNDRADSAMIGDETLWSAGPIERFRLVPPKRAFRAQFLAERECMRRAVVEPLLTWDYDKPVPDQGYRGKAGSHEYPPAKLKQEFANLNAAWFNNPVFDGVRWRLFQEGIETMRAMGAQIIILDPPTHPAYENGIIGSPLAEYEATFHTQLRKYCEDEAIPYLRYTSADVSDGIDAEQSFVSLMHLNHAGAERMTNLIITEVEAMLADDRLLVPEDPSAN